MVGFKARGNVPFNCSAASSTRGKAHGEQPGLQFMYAQPTPAVHPFASMLHPFASISQQQTGSGIDCPDGSKRWLQDQLMKFPFIPSKWRDQWHRHRKGQPAAGTGSTSAQESAAAPQPSRPQKKQGAQGGAGRPARLQPAPLMDPIDATLWEAFSEMDKNGDMQIDWVELRAALEKLGLPCTPEYLVSMMNEYDLDHDNMISWDEFRWYVHKRETTIEKAFKAFDIDGNGQISAAELQTVLAKAGIPAREDDVLRMVDKVDGDYNRTISYDEFRRWAAFLPDSAVAGGNPMMYAAWWRDTSALSTASRRAAESAGGQDTTSTRGSPFQHFVFFDLLVRGALAISLVIVVQSSLDVGGGLE